MPLFQFLLTLPAHLLTNPDCCKSSTSLLFGLPPLSQHLSASLASLSNQTSWVQLLLPLGPCLWPPCPDPPLLYPKSFTPTFVCTQLNKWFKWVDFFHFKYSISNFMLTANASLVLSDSLVDFPSHYTRLLFHTCSILNTLTPPPPSLFSVDELTLLFMRK